MPSILPIPGQTGIYLITNLFNGKVYVGSAAISFERRWRLHRNQLRKGIHHSHHLQASWDKYGEATFRFSVILYCSPEDCIFQEQKAIDDRKAADPRFGYNRCPIAGSNIGLKWTDESKAAKSVQMKKDIEAIERVTAFGRAKKGIKESTEVRAKKSKAHKGKLKSIATKGNMTAAWKLRKLTKPGGIKSVIQLQRVMRKLKEELG